MLRPIVAIAAAALIAGGASAAQNPQAGSHNPIVKDGAPHKVAAPARGANSFTEDQARGRFEKAGYTRVGKLSKANGLWRGSAVKGGKSHTVSLDYKGNVTAH